MINLNTTVTDITAIPYLMSDWELYHEKVPKIKNKYLKIAFIF